ncbi:NAD(P)/FAD-dependent oxidoreductase [Gordonia sp. (in: high G+C Gram-positive bacteria)]|uniref:NAD(P)/FAD-dependent oxidoreductase n=1 Tax=Gordonia sp. (in: high G+C Gram-positive bacteria) TaxID=84139 RepID=UPI003C73DE2C
MAIDEYDGDEYDVAVLGGGPAGLSAALVLGRQQRSTLVFDSGRYRNQPAAQAHMYLGSDGFPPAEIRSRGRVELSVHPNVTVRESTVSSITRDPESGRFRIIDDIGPTTARAIIIAAGQRDIPSAIPGVAERFGDTVVHCPFCHGYESLGRRIVVLSEQPAVPAQPAMQALYVRTHFSDDVILCANGDDVPDDLRHLLAGHRIAIVDNPITGVSGSAGALVVDVSGTDPVHADVAFHVPKFEIGSTVVDDLGCETDGAAILVDAAHRTTVPGVYAAGDIARKRTEDVPLTFISQAVAAGQAAALWCDHDLFGADTGLQS